MRKLFLIILSVSILLSCFIDTASAEVLAVIVPRNQTIRQIDSSELSLIFWRKKLYWNGGKRIQTLNYSASSPLRLQFSLSILKSTPETQADYWNGMYFHGISPPHVVESQEAMLRSVADTADAIGYIDACKLDSRVKALAWINTDGSVSNSQPELNCTP
jgi:ABC-type phosphate transport system substrate-binding protein